ncbi:hypothetical protein AUP68_17232 [Ilyonectria robusta]
MWKRVVLASLAALPAGLASPGSSSAALLQLPDCARNCFAVAIPKSTCSATNGTCLCTNQALQMEVTLCVTETCTVKELLVTKNTTLTSCGAPVRDRSSEYVVLSNVLVVISALCILQRFASRFYWELGLGLDDWFILLTMLCGIPSMVIIVHGAVPNGLGRDVWTLTPDKITSFGMFFHVMTILYFSQITLLKFSMIFLYLRIFLEHSARRILWCTLAFNCVFGILFIFLAVFQCQPISYFWKRWDGEHQGHCLDINAIAWSNATICIVLDLWLLAVPLSQLRTLNLDWKKKVGVGMMFCVGTFVTIVSTLRLQVVIKLGSHAENATWEFIDVVKWSTIEINVGIICACMPSLRLGIARLFPRVLGTVRGSYANYGSHRRSGVTGQSNRSNKSRQLGTSATSHAEPGHVVADSGGITQQRTYAVEFGNVDDETQLVHMKELDRKSSGSDVSVIIETGPRTTVRDHV